MSNKPGIRLQKANPPCMNCDERTIGCHGSCEKYKQYQQECREFSKKRSMDLKINRLYIDNVIKCKKYSGR